MGNFSDTSPAHIKAHFEAHILAAINGDHFTGNESDREKLQWARDRFESEYNYADNKRRYPSAQRRVQSWLEGLALNVAFSYGDIIALSEKWHGFALTERQQEKVCDQWFARLAMTLLSLWRAHGMAKL